MPTLIRFVVILAVLAGIAYGGMLALVAAVKPKDHEVSIRIPTRELLKTPERAPVARREINTNRPAPATPPAPEPAVEASPAAAAGDAPAGGGDVKTLSPGVE